MMKTGDEMQFDYSHDPAGDPRLSTKTVHLMRETRTYWRSLGLSVQFISDATGVLTEWSFRSPAQLEAFIVKNLAGRAYAISEKEIIL